ncbi:MAG TPA: acetyltransferase [Noviherbaspirillum sp.]
MAYFDVFNGDADGICSLHQLRLSDPRPATLVTGPKRDIALLQRTPAGAGDSVTVLDISIDVNREALLALLARGARVDYFDHHGSGKTPPHPLLHACIEPAPGICTALLVDRFLQGAHRDWAIVGAFGDNMAAPARRLAALLGLDASRLAALQTLGTCINYNAYGNSVDDLYIHPAQLYLKVQRYVDPFAFMAQEPLFAHLRTLQDEDLARARRLAPHARWRSGSVFILPDAAWSRRVRGVFGNELATGERTRAHAVLTPDAQDGFVVSVRAPLARPVGADRLCNAFPSGGGRPAAAGINHLPAGELDNFVHAFDAAFMADC